MTCSLTGDDVGNVEVAGCARVGRVSGMVFVSLGTTEFDFGWNIELSSVMPLACAAFVEDTRRRR